MHFDTVTYAPAARMIIDAVGADHVLYGSDVRLLTSLKPRAITLIEGLPLSEKDEHFLVKATRLLKLSDAGIARRM